MRFLKTHLFEMRVQFEDIDAAGAVHHPNYLKFIERARYQALLELDFGFERQLRDRKTFVLAELNSRFVRSLQMGQPIWILTRTVALRRSSLKVVQAIFTRPPSASEIELVGDALDEIEGLSFAAAARFVFVDLETMKPIALPAAALDLLEVPPPEFFTRYPERRDVRLF